MMDADVQKAQERLISGFHRSPGSALSTKQAGGRLRDGLVCRVAAPGGEVLMDMPEAIGGGGSAPSPGFFVRVGLIGCVAIGIKLCAVREGVVIHTIDVDVEMDFDDGALLGIETNKAAPLQTRLTIAVESTAPREDVMAMVGRALKADPFYLAFKEPQNMKVEIIARTSP